MFCSPFVLLIDAEPYVFIALNIVCLQDYKQSYPDVMILDPPESIIKVYNRKSMLQEVASLNFHHPQGLERSLVCICL